MTFLKPNIIKADWVKYREEITDIRHTVFIEEQGVPAELEWDNLDSDAIHFLAMIEEQHVGYVRLLQHGKITRMAVLENYRSQGIGHALLAALELTAINLGLTELKADAQIEALGFYEQRAYQTVSDVFIDAGIEHRSIRKILLAQPRRPTGVYRFNSASQAQVSIIEGVYQAGRYVDILSDSLSRLIYDHERLTKALSALARKNSHSKIRILIKDSKQLTERSHRVLKLAQRLPSHIHIRKLSLEDIDQPLAAYVCIDHCHLIFFNDEASYSGFINTQAKAESNNLLVQYNQLWEQYSEEDNNLRLLTL